jgi:NADPH2:quinone reductase
MGSGSNVAGQIPSAVVIAWERRHVRAIVVEEPGGPEVLQVQTVPDPEPGPTEVLVEVAATGVNFADVVMRQGMTRTRFPLTPGLEGSGTVVGVGTDVTATKPGHRVAWAPVKQASGIGAYAELVAVDEAQVLPVPDDVDLTLAAALPLQGLTAHYLATEQHPVGPGTTVLVHAAAGGTGRLVVQWCHHLGATVLATVSTDEKAATARAAGADHVIRYDHQDFVEETLRLTDGRGADYIVDGVGRTTFTKDLKAVAERGRICVFGMASGPPEPFQPLDLMFRSIVVAGGSMTMFLRDRQEVLAKAQDVWRGVMDGWLDQHVHATLPLEQAAEAHRLLAGRDTTGKLLLSCRS